MSQIQKKFIAPNAVDETKIRLSNNADLKARNAANTGDVNILKVDGSDKVQMESFFQTPATPPSSNYDVANKKYVDDSVSASTPTAASVTYDNTSSGLSATNVQSAIDELETQIDATESSITHLQTLSGVAANSDDLGTFTGVTIPDSSTIKAALQSLETAVELRALDSTVIKKDGSVTYTGNQPMGAHKLTGLSAGSTAGDSVRYEQAILTSGANAFAADQSFGGFKATNLADPAANGDAVTLGYMNARLAGIKPKAAVRAATTTNGTLATAFANGQVIDGVTLATGDRILIKDQSAPADNGIYVVAASGAPTRATDFDSVSPIDEINGAWVSVQEGTANAGKIYVQFGAVATVGTDPINFEYFNAIAGLIGGDMITFSGSTFSVDLATTSGLESTNPGNVSGQLRIKLEASNPSLKFTGSNELAAKLDAAGAIASGAGGLAVQVDGSTIEISSDALRVKDAGITLAKLASNSVDENKIVSTTMSASGAITGGSGTKLAVAVDNSTIEINTNALRIKDAGVTLAKLASNSVDENKIVSTAISTTGALNGGGGTKLSTRVDAATVKINGSNNLEGLKQLEQKISLVSGDITNQFVDLAHAVYGADATNNSISLFVVGGPMQEKAVDYTVSLTGGSGGVTRITFAGDLATGGNAALVSGDKLVISYDYLT